MNKQSIREFFHVLAVIFPLTLVIPQLMQPLFGYLNLAPNAPLAVLLVDTVIVACAVFFFLPKLNKLTSRLFR